jgi:hypothetical protein
LIGFGPDRPVAGCVGDICAALAVLSSHPSYSPGQVDRTVLEPSSAPVLAGRLASIFDRLAGGR